MDLLILEFHIQLTFEHKFFSINTVCVFSLLYDFNNIFSLVCFIAKGTVYIQIHIAYKMGVNLWFMLQVNSRPLVLKFLGNQKLYTDFQLHRGGVVWRP